MWAGNRLQYDSFWSRDHSDDASYSERVSRLFSRRILGILHDDENSAAKNRSIEFPLFLQGNNRFGLR